MDTVLLGWPWLALATAPLLVLWSCLEKQPAGSPPRRRDPAFVLPLLWPMYLVHQFEEHGVDVLGRRYAFLADLCKGLGHAHDLAGCPADAAFIFAVNAVGCQMTFALPWIFRRRAPLVAACAWGVPLVNGVIHLGSAIAHRAYNPGALTSAVLFAPMCAWMLLTVVRSGAIERRQIPRIIAAGAVLHGVLMGSLFLRERGWISHGALLAINVLNGLLPIAFGTLGVKRSAPAPVTAAGEAA